VKAVKIKNREVHHWFIARMYLFHAIDSMLTRVFSLCPSFLCSCGVCMFHHGRLIEIRMLSFCAIQIYVKKKSLHCLVLFWALLFIACTNQETHSNTVRTRIAEQYGISIEEITDVSQLASNTLIKIKQGIVSVKLAPPSKEQYTKYITIIKTALEKYPVSVVKKHLKKIYIGGPFSENGGVIAGMYEKDKLFLFCNPVDGYSSDIFLEQTIHHEFSSILILGYDFPAFDWLDLNPKGFEYIINLSKINEYMNSISSYSPTESQLRQGLVSSYGKANAENDINSYVELIFTQPEKMRAYMDKYPRVGPKYEMIKKFYLSISPEFEAVFDKI
jgi:hypothetical protein